MEKTKIGLRKAFLRKDDAASSGVVSLQRFQGLLPLSPVALRLR